MFTSTHFAPSVSFWHTAYISREFRNFEITAVNSGSTTPNAPQPGVLWLVELKGGTLCRWAEGKISRVAIV